MREAGDSFDEQMKFGSYKNGKNVRIYYGKCWGCGEKVKIRIHRKHKNNTIRLTKILKAMKKKGFQLRDDNSIFCNICQHLN